MYHRSCATWVEMGCVDALMANACRGSWAAVLSVQGSPFAVGEVEEVWLVQVWVVGAGWCRAWWRSAVLLLEEVSMVAAWSGGSMF
jgi:hypothetical protein